MAAFGAPGLSWPCEDGRTVVARGYGVRNIMTKARVDEHTAFPIGSETSVYLRGARHSRDRGKLKWTDRVIRSLPAFDV